MAKLRDLYEAHKAFFESNEKPLFDRTLRYYNGDFYDLRAGADPTWNGSRDRKAARTYATKNLVYAITDSATSVLVGQRVAAAMIPRNRKSEELRPQVDSYVNWVFDENKMRRKASLAVLDAALRRRGIFKAVWDKSKNRTEVVVVDPARLFFDPAVRVFEEIGYFMEVVPMEWDEFKRRVASGDYAADRIADVRPDAFPEWLFEEQQKNRDIYKMKKWVLVIEYYDIRNLTVKHYVPDSDLVVFEDDIPFNPYSMFSLNHNGRNCLGLSDVHLVLNDQEMVNDMLTLLKDVAYLSIPRLAYNAGLLEENEVAAIYGDGEAGAIYPLRPKNANPGMDLRSMIYNVPTPQFPDQPAAAADRCEGNAAFVTAFASGQRGEVRNVRTATEVAFIESQLRDRTANRAANFYDAIAEIAAKCLRYAQLYQPEESPVEVRSGGSGEWMTIGREIADVSADFQAIAWSPITHNPLVVGEKLLELYQLFAESEAVDENGIMAEIFERFGLPKIYLRTPEQIEEMRAQAAAAAAPPGAGGMPGVEGVGGMPVEPGIDGMPVEPMEPPLLPELPELTPQDVVGGAEVGLDVPTMV